MNSNLKYSFESYKKNKCLFVHIPKTAGISVNVSLFDDLGCGHTTLSQFQDSMAFEDFISYFKFTIIRNPWDRILSAFLFLKKGGINQMDKIWSDNNLANFDSFENFVLNWVNKENIKSYTHFIPQHHYICFDLDKTYIDFVGLFENLEDDFIYISKKLGIKTNLKKLNVNKKKLNYMDYYNPKTIEIVSDVYREDIDLFGYVFDNSSLHSQIESR